MQPEKKENLSLKKMSLLLGLVAVLLSFFYFHLHDYLSFENLKTHHDFIFHWKQQHLSLAIGGFICLYIAIAACSIPTASFTTLVGGFLFGPILGTVLVVFSATIGALILFLAVDLAFREWFSQKSAKGIKIMEQGFRENAFNYLLFLRLMPLFPFWLVNIVASLLGVPKRIFVIATFIGIIPASFIFTLIGSTLESLFNADQAPDLTIIFHPQVFLSLLGLAGLSLLSILYKFIKRNKACPK